jgi:hypothetical protein
MLVSSMESAMRPLAVAVVIALLTIAAHSEELTPVQQMEKQRREEAVEVDKAYQKALKNTKSDAPAAKVDPWGNVRSSGTGNSQPQSSK